MSFFIVKTLIVLTCVCSIIFAIETLLPWPLMYYHDLPHACFSVSRHNIKARIALTLRAIISCPVIFDESSFPLVASSLEHSSDASSDFLIDDDDGIPML
jgi:hypothetical protein